jgi:acetyltransferase-like isoleucine patch superfamily enzyme
VGAYSIVDDYCYFSTKVTIGFCCHVASACSVAGGGERQFTFGDFGSLSSGVKIWCTSDDFVNDLVTVIPPGMPNPKGHLISGDVTLGRYCAVGSNSVIMPMNDIPEGVSIGALSFVPARFEFEAWSVYAGTPVRLVRRRNRDEVLRQAGEIASFTGRSANEE